MKAQRSGPYRAFRPDRHGQGRRRSAGRRRSRRLRRHNAVLALVRRATVPPMSDVSDFNKAIIDEFRANHGVVGGGFAGATVVLLTTKGAKSGQTRVNPLVGLPTDDGPLYVFASKGGAPTNPDWYYNLKANPDVTVEFGDDSYRATATEITGAE